MAQTAAPGREATLRQLRILAIQAHAAEEVWVDHLRNVDIHERERIAGTALVTRSTAVRDSLPIIRHGVDYYNFRVDALRDNKMPLDARSDLNLYKMLARFIGAPRQAGMPFWRTKGALPRIGAIVDVLSRSLADIEHQLLLAFQLLSGLADACVEREDNLGIKRFIEQQVIAEQIRAELAEELNPDAVWLKSKNESLGRIENWLERQTGAANFLKQQEELILGIFRRAVTMGFKVQAQRLITDYLRPIDTDE